MGPEVDKRQSHSCSDIGMRHNFMGRVIDANLALSAISLVLHTNPTEAAILVTFSRDVLNAKVSKLYARVL